VNKELASGVERELGPSSIVKRDPNGDVTFNVPCANRWAFRSWLLGMVDRAEVLEPAAVRSEVIDWLKGVDHG
jgi:predicted DNA-binding transcriptional regulator YafY